jgi:5-methylthioribose kinase
LSQVRGNFEREYLKMNNEIYPGTSPKVYFYDEEHYYVCMEYLVGFGNVKEAIIKGEKNENLSKALGDYFAIKSFNTSNLSKSSFQMFELISKFTGNQQVRNLVDHMNFNRGFCKNELVRHPEIIQKKLIEIQSCSSIMLNVANLKTEMHENVQNVCHGDFHTGSVMIKDDQIFIIDAETATIGPIGYDIGIFFGNIITGFAFQNFFEKSERYEYKKWLLKVILEIWEIFENKFISLWRDSMDENFWSKDDFKMFQEDYLRKVKRSTIGYMGIIVLRSGIEKWPEYSHLENVKPETVSIYILKIAEWILSSDFESLDGVIKGIEKI